jgi:hypothetical protein
MGSIVSPAWRSAGESSLIVDPAISSDPGLHHASLPTQPGSSMSSCPNASPPICLYRLGIDEARDAHLPLLYMQGSCQLEPWPSDTPSKRPVPPFSGFPGASMPVHSSVRVHTIHMRSEIGYVSLDSFHNDTDGVSRVCIFNTPHRRIATGNTKGYIDRRLIGLILAVGLNGPGGRCSCNTHFKMGDYRPQTFVVDRL